MTITRNVNSHSAALSDTEIDAGSNSSPAPTASWTEETPVDPLLTKISKPTVSLRNVDTLHGRPKAATLPSGQKIIPAALILLHQTGTTQVKLAENWFKRLGFVPIFIEKMSSEQAIKKIEDFKAPPNHAIQVVLFELNYSNVGSKEPNYALIDALTNSEKIKPQFLIGCSFTPECIANFKMKDQYQDKVTAIELLYIKLEEAVKKNDQPRKHSYHPQ